MGSTANLIRNYNQISNFILTDLRNQSLRKYRTAVINVGTTPDTLRISSKQSFESADEESKFLVYKSTTTF